MEKSKEEFKLMAEEQLKRLKEETQKRIKVYWENELPKFINPEDVPELPHTNEEEWKSFYVPKLIESGAVPKKDLIVGQFYIGEHRRATIAKWTGKEFVYRRTKFNSTFDDFCNHFEDDDGYALFVPLRIGTEEEYEKNSIG